MSNHTKRSHTPPMKDFNYIPMYDPKTSIRSLEDWLVIVHNARETWNWTEAQTVQRAGAVLGGEAAKWYMDWIHPDPTWGDFRLSLTRRCKSQFTFLDRYKKAISFTSDMEKTYFEYCEEKNRLLESVFKVQDEEDRVSIIIDGIMERSTKNHLTGLLLKSVHDLYDVISRFEDRKIKNSEFQHDKKTFFKRSFDNRKYSGEPVKRDTGSEPIKKFRRLECYGCGSTEHLKAVRGINGVTFATNQVILKKTVVKRPNQLLLWWFQVVTLLLQLLERR